MQEETTIVNGKEIVHKDVVHLTITTDFSFWDRVKILLGKKLIINSQIYTKNDEVNIVHSFSKPTVQRLIKRKPKYPGGYACLELNTDATN